MERLSENLKMLRNMRERLSAMLARVKADPELQGALSSLRLHATLRFAAFVLPRSWAMSKLTRWPSFSPESPERSTALICTNTSGPPSSG